jgi:heptosyltransferase-1
MVQPESLRTLLLVELNRLGDVVHAFAAARALKARLPGASITMVMDKKHVELARLEPSVEDTIGAEHSLAGFLRGALEVRKREFDCVLSLSPIRRNALFSRLARRRSAAGYLRVWQSGPNFLRDNKVTSVGIPLVRHEKYGYDHISLTALKVTRALGFSDAPGKPLAPGELLSEATSLNGPLLVLHPLAGWRYREWPEARVRDFLDALLSQTDFTVAIIGSGADKKRLEALSQGGSFPDRILIRAGLPLDRLVALLRSARIMVGTDSGPYHLACALGIPTVGLFGPAPPEITGSSSPLDPTCYRRVDCSPCWQRRCIRPEDPCMGMITSGDVLAAVQERLLTGGKD